MRPWMRSQDDSAGQVSSAQLGIDRGLQGKVGEPVVDEVNRPLQVAQNAIFKGQLARRYDDGIDSMAAE